MRKTVIIYHSTYGATKAYACHIAAALGADLLEQKSVTLPALLEYDTIIFGGGIYAGAIQGAKEMRRLMEKLSDKLLVIFSVGFTPLEREDLLAKVVRNSFGDALQKELRFFHFPGTVDYPKLSPLHRMMMQHQYHVLSKKDKAELTEANLRFLQDYGKPPQPLPMEQTQPLIEYVRNTGIHTARLK